MIAKRLTSALFAERRQACSGSCQLGLSRTEQVCGGRTIGAKSITFWIKMISHFVLAMAMLCRISCHGQAGPCPKFEWLSREVEDVAFGPVASFGPATPPLARSRYTLARPIPSRRAIGCLGLLREP